MNPPETPPLAGLFVLDFVTGPMAAIGRTLAELGAQVVRVEPLAGACDRPAPGAGEVEFTALNAGKRSAAVDLGDASDRARLDSLLAAAAIVLLDAAPRAHFPLDPVALRQRHPGLVVLSVSDFGSGGDCAGWSATDPVLHALSGTLARSGLEGRAPLIPPGRIAEGAAASQAVYAVLLAYFQRLRGGRGAHLDFSVLDGAANALDPGYGIGGSAQAGERPCDLPRGRPPRGYFYPILNCADGRVRICVLAPRQWRAMFAWMGSPAAFADPKYDSLQVRFDSPDLNPAIERFFADKTRAELERAGEAVGVPVGSLLTLEEALASEQVRARRAVTSVAGPSGALYTLPNGMLEIDGERLGPRRGAPALGEYRDDPESAAPLPSPSVSGARPLAGLKVLDLGIIVVGADQGRLLADQGADVVKIESAAFPDGSRQSPTGAPMTHAFAAGNRNKRCLGLNLRHPEGRALFLELARQADVILSNFKPGTLANLGLDYAAVSAVNPRIIMVDSSAFGASGPWSRRMGYGPLVRATTGLAERWRYPGDADSYSDSITVYPDHTAARYGVIGALALLIRRLRSGRGGSASVAQAEIMLGHMAADIGRLEAGLAPAAPDAPWGVFPCRGEDEWCAITVRNDADWLALCHAIDRPDLAAQAALADRAGRCAQAARIERELAAWTGGREPREVMATLQNAGVPAGAMLRVTELPEFPHFARRRFFRSENHPLLPQPFLAENAPVRCADFPDPPIAPAPVPGQHSREVAAQWLGLAPAEIERLLAAGVLEVAPTCAASAMAGSAPAGPPAEPGAAGPESTGSDLAEPDPARPNLTGTTPARPEPAGLDPAQPDPTGPIQAGPIQTGPKTILVERRGHILLITLNRPEARNAINRRAHIEIGSALEQAQADPEVRVVILTGAGDKAFCAGADLVALARGESVLPENPQQRAWGFAGFVSHPIDKPVIAAVNGFALGGGTEIALAADLVVASETASFGLPEVKRGIYAGAGGAFRAVQQLPRKIGMEILLTGDRIDARRAHDIGLVNRVVAPERLLDEAFELAGRIAANAPLAVQASKRIALGIDGDRIKADDEHWARSEREGSRVMASEDAREGPLAFAEKREPNWRAR